MKTGSGARRVGAAAGTAQAGRQSLPAWVYSDPGFFAQERQRIFMRSWQLACHVGDLPAPGDYCRFDLLDEPIVVLRGDDGALRAFFNVCRHRAARLLDGGDDGLRGTCAGGRIRCPYHAWTYDLAGRLVGVPREAAYEGLDKAAHGLRPVEVEEWLGFVFVRVEPGGPSVAEMMAPVTEELAAYRIPEMRPLGRLTLRPRPVNWKTITDNYADGLHIAPAHAGLRRIVGRSYAYEPLGDVFRITGELELPERAGWSERMYCRHLPEAAHLPPARRRLWAYYLMWPNLALDVYPDQIDFMQMLPLGPTETLIREIPYALPDASREMRAARYLNWRINRQVNREDTDLIERVQAGMGSRSFDQGPLSREETLLHAFAERLRRVLPAARLPEPPPAGEAAPGPHATA